MGRSKSLRVLEGIEILTKILKDTELHRLEADGFLRGMEKGKTMKVDLLWLVSSLDKQYKDWQDAFHKRDPAEMKRTLADLRNLAGCVFLKIKEREG